MTRLPGLRATQRWFLGEIERASALPRPRGRARATPRAGDIVAPSPTLAPAERVAIYQRMYLARLNEALENDYPVLVAILGHGRFHDLARRYVTRHRPSSWTLNDLGAALPAFVAKRRGLPRAALAADVARIERAMSDVFDAEVTTVLRPADVAAVAADAWATARLVPSPALRVLALSTRANRVITDVREGRPAPRTSPRGESWVAVWRKDDRVWRLDLTEPMHAALAALVRGRPLPAALAAARRVFPGDPADLPAHVRTWFAQWIDEEFFAGIDVAPAASRRKRAARDADPQPRRHPRRATTLRRGSADVSR